MSARHLLAVVLALLAGGLASAGCAGRLASRAFEPTLASRRGWHDPAPYYEPAPPAAAEPEARSDVGPEPEEPEPAEEPSPPAERPHVGDGSLHRLELRGVPLSEALHLIASMAGVNVYLDATLAEPVDASFPSVTLDDALGVLLSRNGLRLEEDPPGVFWVTRDDGSEVESARIELSSVNAEDVREPLEALLPDDVALVVDASQNLVLVRGRRDDVEAAREYLAQADERKRQVLIEVEILEVILDDRFELGIEGVLTDPDVTGDFGVEVVQDLATMSDAFTATLDWDDGDVTTTINALESYGAVQVLSSPRVLAMTNTTANIEVITEVPYIETTTSITSESGQLGTTSQESVAFKEAGIKLQVLPVVQGDGIVHLSIDQEFSEVVDFFAGVPVLDSRRLTTRFLVQESDTVVLGGLIQNRETEADRGVPLLMHVPLVGRLFRSNEDTAERRELVVFLTPRVVDPEEAASLARRYRSEHEERRRASGLRPRNGR